MNQDLFSNPLVIAVIFSGIGVFLIGAFDLIGSATQVRGRLQQYVVPLVEAEKERPSVDSGSFRIWLNKALAILSSESLRIKLITAQWNISDREYILLQIALTLFGLAAGWLISGGIIGGIGLAIFLYMLPGLLLYRSMDVRRQKFQNQLLDALILIRGATQAGLSLLQSLDLVKDQLPAPASEEFSRVVREVQIGLPLSQALINLSGRMESDDLYMLVTAININSQVGGNLSTMLNAVSNTIRSRLYLFGEVRALTAYARYSSYLLTILPFGTALVIYLTNPSYFDSVPTSLFSQIILIIAAIMLVVGNIWVRQIVKIKI